MGSNKMEKTRTESVGTEERFGDSAGCIRVLPEQGQVIWDWLQEGDEVRILT